MISISMDISDLFRIGHFELECPKLQTFSKNIFESCTSFHVMPFKKIIGFEKGN